MSFFLELCLKEHTVLAILRKIVENTTQQYQSQDKQNYVYTDGSQDKSFKIIGCSAFIQKGENIRKNTSSGYISSNYMTKLKLFSLHCKK